MCGDYRIEDRYNPSMLRPYRGRLPVVDPSTYVDPSAQVIGDVEIGPECSLWMNAMVRDDVNRIRIDARTNLQNSVIVHVMHHTYPTTIGDDVTIGHGAIAHGCTIGNRVLIGMGAILLNGATIGDESIVAAGSLVTEDFVAPPRSLVMGRPARVRRPVTDDEIATIREYGENYVGYRLDYMPAAE